MLNAAINFPKIYIVNLAVLLTLIDGSFSKVVARSLSLPKRKTENKDITVRDYTHSSASLLGRFRDRPESKYLAQLPNPETPDFPPQPLPQLPSDRDIPFKSPPLPSPDGQDLLNIPGTITVKEFRFEGNTAFSDRQLAQVTAPYTNKPISFVQLLEAETAVRDKYLQGCDANNRRNGTEINQPCYVNSDALIPIQKIEDGIITMQIVEGAIANIAITGTKDLAPNYIRSRLELVTQKQPFNLNELLEALRLLQLDPLIGSVSAELSPGVRPEKSLLTVNVTEADSFALTLSTDNNRSPRCR